MSDSFLSRIRGRLVPALAQPHPPADVIPAAVLIPLIVRPAGPTVLLTERAADLADHAGQISFPGGRLETGEDPVAAALRETEEEVGLGRTRIEVLGRLAPHATGTGFWVTPVVGLVQPPFALRLAATEVAAAFEVPLAFVCDPTNHRRETAALRGVPRTYDVLVYGERRIWGATAGMLVALAVLGQAAAA